MKKFLAAFSIISGLFLVLLLGSLAFRISYHKEIKSTQAKARKDSISIQINILNGTKVSGLANQFRNYFRSKGFDVVEVDNFSEHVNKSYLIDRVGDKNTSKKIAKILGINDSLIKTEIDSGLYLKCSVILGDDYKSFQIFKK